MKLPIYLDYNSTTPCDPRVVDAMIPYFAEKFGNAASKTHSFGWIAEEAVEYARTQIAQLIGAEMTEIIFTSGATESINLALKGVFETYRSKGKHIITIATEHKAVLDTCHHLKKSGAEITFLPVNAEGLVDLDLVKKSIKNDTILLCVMLANNETGVIQPIKKLAEIAHEKNIFFMSDATQAVGKIETDINDLGIDLLVTSAHKFYGPKGIGILYVRRKDPRVNLSPLIDGGGHERGLRSGTLNVPAIVGMGKAAEIAKREMRDDFLRLKILRDHLESELLKTGRAVVNGSLNHRMSHVNNLTFHNVEGSGFVSEVAKKIAISSGSACTSASPESSHVLKAMGINEKSAQSSIRFSLGKFTSQEEIDFTIEFVKSKM
jgi:cysteine desulfurase